MVKHIFREHIFLYSYFFCFHNSWYHVVFWALYFFLLMDYQFGSLVTGIFCKKKPLEGSYNAAGGGRTHTPGKGNWILSPARLPIPPQRHLTGYVNYTKPQG